MYFISLKEEGIKEQPAMKWQYTGYFYIEVVQLWAEYLENVGALTACCRYSFTFLPMYE
jgi:hypothetical protein